MLVSRNQSFYKKNRIGQADMFSLVYLYGNQVGTFLDDLESVSINQVCHLPLFKLWRYHSDITLWKSTQFTQYVNQALQSTVPGITSTQGEPVTYREVFSQIQSLEWPGDVFLLGGVVRDLLMRKIPNDIDISVSCPPKDLQQLCDQNHWKFYTRNGNYFLIGNKEGTNYLEGKDIFSHLVPDSKGEFCMNMIFYDIQNEILIDKTGRGIQDIQQNRISFSNHNWQQWFDLYKFVRFYKFRLRGYQAGLEETEFILQTFQEQYTPTQGKWIPQLLLNLPNSHRLLNLVSQDILRIWPQNNLSLLSWYTEFLSQIL